jgi:hypothetical protein
LPKFLYKGIQLSLLHQAPIRIKVVAEEFPFGELLKNRIKEVIHSPEATSLKNRGAKGLGITSHRYDSFRLLADQKIFGSILCPNDFLQVSWL